MRKEMRRVLVDSASLPDDVRKAGYEACDRYRWMIWDGESPRMAEMLALKQAPSCRTDDTIFAGQKNNEQFADCPELGAFYARKLIASGGSPRGKVYKHSLADEPGDPEAWVSSAAEMRALAIKRGYEVSGAITVKRNRDCLDNGINTDDLGVADDIIDAEVHSTLSRNPELAPTPKERARFREELKEKRSPKRGQKVAPAGSAERKARARPWTRSLRLASAI